MESHSKLKLNLLYVEDDAITREALAEFLKKIVKKVYLADNGANGLKIYKKNNIDIVLTDIKMPVMNGLEMIKEMKKDDYDLPIIVTTAYNEIEYLIDSIELGVNSFLIKPIDTEKLYKVLNRFENIINMRHNVVQLATLLSEYKNAIDVSSIMFKIDSKGNIIYFNKHFEEISLYRENDLEGFIFLNIIYPNSQSYDEIIDYISSGTKNIWKGELKLRKKDGFPFYIDATIVPILDEHNELLEYMVLGFDITELVNKKEELIKQLYIDQFTGLPNRKKLFEDLENYKNPSLIITNIDSFRELNDFYGHEIGDFIIKDIARKLLMIVPDENWVLYKLQADEYAILITKKVNFIDVERFLMIVIEEINSKSIVYNDYEINVSVSMGVALSENISSKEKVRDLMLKADMALKKAKALKKDYIFYNESFQIVKEYEKNIYWAKELKKAIYEDRIIPFFQPIMNNQTKLIEKYECLARLIDNDGNIISPASFLQISKKSKLYPNITRIVLDKCLQFFKTSSAIFSINISILDIIDPETFEFIEKRLKENLNLTHRLIFEIVESEGIENYIQVKEFIDLVKNMGCKIAIDDFGSGYSNFSHILKLNVDFLKIDASLIKDITVDRNAELIVQTIVSFSKWLGVKTVAEWVHSREVLEKVVSLDIDYSQGYYIGQPMPKIKT
ncbi:MAG: EAL domain-containing protein [Brevinematales bacterium]|nr:EAL domain-containing protein [Brevinematales bacterium]